MIPAALQVLAFLNGLSPKVKAGVAAALLLLSLCVGLVLFGEHHAAAKIAVQARADTTKAALVVLDTAQAREAKAVATVVATKPATVSTGVIRQQARDVVTVVDSQTVKIGAQLDTVPPAVVALIKADDAKIAADSVRSVAVDSLLLPAITSLEAAHAAVDTAQSHQITQGNTNVRESSHVPLVVGILAVAEGARIAYNFFHHRPLFP